MIDYLNNVESEYRGILYEESYEPLQQKITRFLPEESDKFGCHAGVIQNG